MEFADEAHNDRNDRRNILPGGFMNALVPKWRSRVIYVPQAVPPLAGSPKDLLREAYGYSSRKSSVGMASALVNIDASCKDMEVSLGLPDGKLSGSWNSLSGGERQRGREEYA